MNQPTRSAVIAAFAAVYVIWGSTYLTIKLAIDSIPPFLMAGSRFVLAGLMLYGFSRWRGAPKPDLREWRRAAIVGFALLLVGNGGVTFGELYVPSGLTALLIALVPVFMALMGWFSGMTARPSAMVWGGLAFGLAGVGLLIQPDPSTTPHPRFMLGAGIVLLAALVWSGGSLYSKAAPSRTTPFAGAGMQMICGGAMQLAMGGLLGEGRGFQLSQVTMPSFLCWLYLIFIGSLVGFTAYIWLLRHCAPAQVATYAYVNPVVAVFLGTMFGGEKITPSMLTGGALILAAVVVVLTQEARAAASPSRKRVPIEEPSETV